MFGPGLLRILLYIYLESDSQSWEVASVSQIYLITQ